MIYKVAFHVVCVLHLAHTVTPSLSTLWWKGSNLYFLLFLFIWFILWNKHTSISADKIILFYLNSYWNIKILWTGCKILWFYSCYSFYLACRQHPRRFSTIYEMKRKKVCSLLLFNIRNCFGGDMRLNRSFWWFKIKRITWQDWL